MNIHIPNLQYTFYGPIVLLSIVLGIIIACILMRNAGVKSVTCFYTAIFTFISILVCSAVLSISITGDIRKVGFVGAGGALGLIVGAVASALIHRDHISESMSAWIIVAPLMYGLSKIGCHIAGCCNGIPYNGFFTITYAEKGHISYFPIQITETIVFVLIFIIGLILYLKSKNKTRVAILVLLLSGIAKIGLEFLRESHIGHTITSYQIIVLSISIIGAVSLHLTNRSAKAE